MQQFQFEESPLYRLGIEKARKAGIEEGLAEGCAIIASAKGGKVGAARLRQLARLDPRRLRRIVVALALAADARAVRAVLALVD